MSAQPSKAPLKKPRTPKAYKRAAVEAAFDTLGMGPLDDWLRLRCDKGITYAMTADSIYHLTRVEVTGECVRLWVKKLPQVEDAS